MALKKIITFLLSTLLLVWLITASVRTAYNLSKLITEEPKWFFLTTEQKKEKQFGEKHHFFRFVQKYVPPNSNALLYTSDGMVYYLARYYLYPTTVIWGERQFTEWKNDINRNYDYVLNFPVTDAFTKNRIVVNNVEFTKRHEFIHLNSVKGTIYKK